MKILLRGIHLLENAFRHAGDAFAAIQPPTLEQAADVQIEVVKGEAPHDYLVVLRVKSGPQSQYTFEIGYGVLITVDPETEVPPENLLQRITATGATIAYPFCRELLSNLTARGRFGIVWLNPIDFGSAVSQQGDAQKAAAGK